MNLLPAIDILDGRVVRLTQGDYAQVTIYNDDPVDQARRFEEQGARWLHVIDLNGAIAGKPQNQNSIDRIISSVSCKIEVGGGIRTIEALEHYAAAGAQRMVLGTSLVQEPDFACKAARMYGERIVAGIDARDGQVAIQGWREGAAKKSIALALDLADMGIKNLVYTDISRDGMQSGVDAEAYAKLARQSKMSLVASGGISSLDDLRNLEETGMIWGAVCGKALYEGKFTLQEANELLDRLEAEGTR